jgi:6,7-dimethyl-8-ribityllumazine synthase
MAMGRYDGIEELEPDTNGAGLRIGIVMGRFNIDVGDGLLSSCTAGLVKHGVAQKDMRIVTVPGALEIPGAIALADQADRYDGYVAIGVVIRGETYHFEIVAGESARGVMALTMDGMAVGNGILTVENEAQALVRADPAQKDKGGEAAKAALALLALRTRYA